MYQYLAPLETVLYLSSVVIKVTLRRQWRMCFVRETAAVSRVVITQRLRYGWMLIGQIAVAAAVLWPILQYGVEDTFRVLDAWRHVSLKGWMVVALYWVGIFSPALTALATIAIHRRPTTAAKRVPGGFLLTEHVRQGLARPLVVRPVVAPGSSGAPTRVWVNVA